MVCKKNSEGGIVCKNVGMVCLNGGMVCKMWVWSVKIQGGGVLSVKMGILSVKMGRMVCKNGGYGLIIHSTTDKIFLIQPPFRVALYIRYSVK